MAGRRHFRGLTEINITSLVDVTLTLLIIFMLTAPYIQGGVEVNLPEAETRTQIVREGPVISVTDNRQVYFMEDPVEIADLPLLMAPYAAQRDSLPVYLRCGEEVPYGMVVRVMAALEREGFLNLSLVADPPGAGEEP